MYLSIFFICNIFMKFIAHSNEMTDFLLGSFTSTSRSVDRDHADFILLTTNKSKSNFSQLWYNRRPFVFIILNF